MHPAWRVAPLLPLAWLIGMGAQLQQATLWPAAAFALLSAAALAACLAGLRLRGFPWAGTGVLLAGVLVLGFAGTGWRAATRLSHALPVSLEGADLRLVGRVASMPLRSEAGQRFVFEPEAAWIRGQPVDVRGPVLLGWWQAGERTSPGAGGSVSPVVAGDRWAFTVRLRAPHGTLNPAGFDQELWLWEQGIPATGSVRTAPPPERLGRGWSHPVERLRQQVRDAIFARVPDTARAGVLAALVVGDQRAIDRAGWEVFRATGVAHLMSISGLHVTMFAWLAAGAVQALWRRSGRLCLRWPAQHAGLVAGMVLAAAYAVFSGWGVPAQRTVWMLGWVGGLRLLGIRWPWPLAWLAVAAGVAALDPWALLQAGFWLSFVAVGVLFAGGPAQAGPISPPPGWRGRLVGLLREQVIVTVALAPLTLLLFGQLSLVSLPANLVAIPVVTLAITPLALAGIVCPPLWTLAGTGVAALGAVLAALAGVPGAVWTSAQPPWPLAAVALAGGVLLVLRLPLRLRALGLPLVLPAFLWQPARPAAGGFDLLAVDVGQGSAVLVRTASASLLYDTGPRYGVDSDAGQRLVVPLLRALGERPRLVMVSHRDSDHSGGVGAVLHAFPAALRSASFPLPGEPPAPDTPCQAGQRWDWDGVAFEVLHPTADDYQVARHRPNAMSCVLRVTAADGTAALLTGDIERPQERALLDREAMGQAATLRADALLVPHHGSRTSSSEEFLERVRPRIALVQAGYRNRFGHPAPAVMARYRARGLPVVVSTECGAAWWSSVAPGQVRCERELARRYWHHAPTQHTKDPA